MTRTVMIALISAVLMPGQQHSSATTGTWHFTTSQTTQSLQEAASMIRVVGAVPDVSIDNSLATLSFSGPAEDVNFAEWVLPRIDKPAGDDEFRFPSGKVGKVRFLENLSAPQDVQELLTALRVVADVQRIYVFSAHHALVFRGAEWEVAFAEWIIGQIDQPQRQKPDTTPHEFTVGGPDFRGMGHGARVNFLSGMTSPLQSQELLTVLRTVGDIAKVFSCSTGHAFVLRAGDADLQRAEWMIQQIDQSPVTPGPRVWATPAGDDVTRILFLGKRTPQEIKMAVNGLRAEAGIRKVFSITSPATIVVRGTTDQIGAAMAWLTSHNELAE